MSRHVLVSPRVLAFVLTVLSLVLVAAVVWAGALIHDSFVSTCTTLNCSSESIRGTYILDGGGRAIPWTAQLFSNGGECVRVQVTEEGTDLETVLVSPNGTTWRNDDGGGAGTVGGACFLCPLIKANTPAGINGWYTVSVSHFAGNGVTANFLLRYGRYPLGNPNCSGATVPLSGDVEPDKE